MKEGKSVSKNGLMTVLSGGGFSLTAAAGACGGACATGADVV